MEIPYPLALEITCSQTLTSRKMHFVLLNQLSVISNL